jgi:hypothetical protein
MIALLGNPQPAVRGQADGFVTILPQLRRPFHTRVTFRGGLPWYVG